MKTNLNLAGVQEPWTIALLIGVVALIFGYLYFRKKPALDSNNPPLQQIELKLKGVFSPEQTRIKAGHPVQMLIHRFDMDPVDEIFEIDELGIYDLLPAAHTTIVTFLPEKKGKFKMILAGEREAGLMIVE
jgi:plastocyanin domain-containing protein